MTGLGLVFNLIESGKDVVGLALSPKDLLTWAKRSIFPVAKIKLSSTRDDDFFPPPETFRLP
jgi:hypothetical protein